MAASQRHHSLIPHLIIILIKLCYLGKNVAHNMYTVINFSMCIGAMAPVKLLDWLLGHIPNKPAIKLHHRLVNGRVLAGSKADSEVLLTRGD